jgi:hypothetical protein
MGERKTNAKSNQKGHHRDGAVAAAHHCRAGLISPRVPRPLSLFVNFEATMHSTRAVRLTFTERHDIFNTPQRLFSSALLSSCVLYVVLHTPCLFLCVAGCIVATIKLVVISSAVSHGDCMACGSVLDNHLLTYAVRRISEQKSRDRFASFKGTSVSFPEPQSRRLSGLTGRRMCTTARAQINCFFTCMMHG